MQYGLDDITIQKIQQVFEAFWQIDKAILYGSRAKGNFKPGSDIDITLKGAELSLSVMNQIALKLDDLLLPYTFDLSVYSHIKNSDLIEHIDRVGVEYYSRWKEYVLGDAPLRLIDGDRGKNYPSQDEYKPQGDCLFLSTKNVRFDGFDLTDCQFITREKDSLLKKGKLVRNDLVLTTRGTIGNIGFYSSSVKYDSIRINSGMVIIRPDAGEILPIFNYYIFRLLQKDFLTFTTGSAQPQLPIKDLIQIGIKVPPLLDQNNISVILLSIDNKIDLLHRQNKTLEQLAETLFRQWFVEEAEDDWEERKLGELLTITSSKRIFYSEYVSSGVPFYRSKEIIELRNSGFTNSELYISNERFKDIEIKYGYPKEGDILMTSVGTLGVAYRVKKTDRFYFKDGNLTWFKNFKGLPSSIVYLWLISKIGQEKLASITIGSTQEALTIDGLKGISFKIPPHDKVKEYQIEFDTIIMKMEFNQSQIQSLTKMRDTLLPKLMSGEVRVKMPE